MEAAEALESRLNDSPLVSGDADADWTEFCVAFEKGHMDELSRKSRQQWDTTRKVLEEIINPSSIADLTPANLARFLSKLTGAPSTRKQKMAWVRVALRWAERMRIIDRAPMVPMPRNGSEPSVKRGITVGELRLILEATDLERPEDSEDWKRLIKGLFHSGMRISELVAMSWSEPPVVLSKPDGLVPRVTIAAGGQKNRKQQVVPVTPEFWEVATETKQEGRVFPLGVTNLNAIIRTIRDIGARSNVVTDPTSGRTATSTDIGRRSFATRMAAVLQPQELAAWMRHSSPETTARHYYRANPDELAKGLWKPKNDRQAHS